MYKWIQFKKKKKRFSNGIQRFVIFNCRLLIVSHSLTLFSFKRVVNVFFVQNRIIKFYILQTWCHINIIWRFVDLFMFTLQMTNSFQYFANARARARAHVYMLSNNVVCIANFFEHDFIEVKIHVYRRDCNILHKINVLQRSGMMSFYLQ